MDTQPTTNTLQTNVKYTIGMLEKPSDGILAYDGAGIVHLIDATTNTPVFSKPLQELGKVTRAEYALYMTVPGINKKVAVMFGNAKRYIGENAAMMPFGVPGAIGGVVRSNKLNEQSGLEAWVALFKANGKITNLSPNVAVVIAVIIAVIIVGIGVVVSLF